MELFKLFGSIFVDNEQANNSIHQTEENAERTGNTFLSGVGKAAKWGVAIAGAATVAIGGMLTLANKTAETADFIDKLSERTGVNREELQRWKYAAEQSGADVSKFEVGVKKLSSAMDGANSGSKGSIEAFSKLGISMQEVQAKSPSEMLDTVMKKLADMPDSAERNALGNELLGKSYQDMLPLLNAGSQGIEDLKNRANELGLVMSEEAVKANVKFGDTLADVKSSFSAIFMHISNEFLPILQLLLDYILKYMPQIQAVLSVVFGVIGEFAKGAINIIQTVIDALDNFFSGTTKESEEFKKVFDEFKKWFDEIFKMLTQIAKIAFDELKAFWDRYGEDIVKVIRIAFDNIKIIIETALNVIKGIIEVVLGLISGNWDKVWNGLGTIVKSILGGIGEILPNMLEGLVIIIKDAGKLFLEAGANLFEMLWEGIKSIWKNISEYVNEKIDWLKDQLTFWDNSSSKLNSSSSKGSYGVSRKIDGSHADGLNYVPFDGYIAQLHKGERVLTANENKEFNSSIDYTSLINQILASINALIQEIQNQPYKEREILRKGVVI